MKKEQKDIWMNRVILALIILNIILTGRLAYSDFLNPGICGTEGCNVVQSSGYSELFGIKLSYFGFVSFLILLLGFIYLKKYFIYLASVGLFFALYLMILQIFVIGKICVSCMTIDILMVVIFGLSYEIYGKDLKGIFLRR